MFIFSTLLSLLASGFILRGTVLVLALACYSPSLFVTRQLLREPPILSKADKVLAHAVSLDLNTFGSKHIGVSLSAAWTSICMHGNHLNVSTSCSLMIGLFIRSVDRSRLGRLYSSYCTQDFKGFLKKIYLWLMLPLELITRCQGTFSV